MYPARARTRAARSEVHRTNHKANASFISPIAPPSPGWEATPSQGYLPASNLWLPICTLGWRKPVHIPMGRLAGVKRLSQEHGTIFD